MPSKSVNIKFPKELISFMNESASILYLSMMTICYAISDRELSQLVKFVTSKGLKIEGFVLEDCSKVTNFGLLAQLNKAKIKSLALYKTTKMMSIWPLCGLRSLCKLIIDDCSGVTNFGPLIGLVNLQYLDLKQVPEKSMFPKLQFLKLQCLYIEGKMMDCERWCLPKLAICDISFRDIGGLKWSTKLKSINLPSVRFFDPFFFQKKFPRLESISYGKRRRLVTDPDTYSFVAEQVPDQDLYYYMIEKNPKFVRCMSKKGLFNAGQFGKWIPIQMYPTPNELRK